MTDIDRPSSGEVISVHLYSLRAGTKLEQLRETAQLAAEQGLFELPGLSNWWFGEHMKGGLPGQASSFWVYESRAAWEALWGTLENPVPPAAYPELWVTWEQEYLGPLLDRPADAITFGSYQTWLNGPFRPSQAV